MEGWLWRLCIRLRYLCQSARLHTRGLLLGARDSVHLSFPGAGTRHMLWLLPLVNVFHVENSKT